MSMIIHFANMIFKPIINLGAAPMMMIVLTLIALCFKVKFSKALEGGIKLAIALTTIGSVIVIPAREMFLASYGHPCSNDYLEY